MNVKDDEVCRHKFEKNTVGLIMHRGERGREARGEQNEKKQERREEAGSNTKKHSSVLRAAERVE